jgi:hypothetical protein
MELPDFDRDFVMEWECKHCQCQGSDEDEHEYQEIIKAVQRDIAKINTICQDTLDRILKWKDKRELVKTKVNWGQYNVIYTPRFRLIIADSVPDHHKLFILIWDKSELSKKLPVASGVLDNIHGKASGFGVPMASTILHFIFPNRFPIIDIRTAETVYLACKIKSPKREDHRIYDPFRSTILEIAKKTRCTLHQIDRALFAYHKDIIQPQMDAVCKTWIATGEHRTTLNLTLDAPSRMRRIILDALKKDS